MRNHAGISYANMKRRQRCPACGAKVEKGRPGYPFCSERCRYVDLGNWLDGKYRIPVAFCDPDEEDETPPTLSEEADE